MPDQCVVLPNGEQEGEVLRGTCLQREHAREQLAVAVEAELSVADPAGDLGVAEQREEGVEIGCSVGAERAAHGG